MTADPGRPAGHFSALLGAAAAEGAAHIPVTVLSGFLGSGKTTLLNRVLRLPDLQGTAVIVNEFGEVGIDHDLIAETHEDTVLLANGCLCCAVRGDLVEALLRLAARPVPPLRVLIETSGLADPGPILRTLMAEGAVRERFSLAGVACTVDAVLGADTLTRQPEAARQLAVADTVFFTKTDLAPVMPALRALVQSLNPAAELNVDAGPQPQALLALASASGTRSMPLAAPAYRSLAAAAPPPDARHGKGIRSFVVVREQPLPREAFAAWLDMLTAMRGEDLLRIKGLVALDDDPGRPLVVHGVQHLFHPPVQLAAWPSADQRTRLVFITRGVDDAALEHTLDVLVRRHRRAARAPHNPNSPDPFKERS